MPAKDIFHNCVKNSLVKAGWTITHDPFRIRLTRKNLFVDLGAERLIAADRGTEKIAVEIKSFTRASDIKDLEDALGQFILYERLLFRYAPERTLYLAVTHSVYKTVFEEEAGQILLEDKLIRLLTFDPNQEVIKQWIST
ncbi:XisH family protein [Limnothrix sp. FACHB-708]|uniref:element excision factor XisH family protein n=1 Tax=unclassified Limnothrix TaxID=2632864 RepID=UPI0016869ACE|nr:MULTISPECIES: element excision factor XisH family protein [unclassified Limnothrix]MBD2552969.1 XisH family protein [Limnothrix sp. FACHB-708]MBD2589219.1 XisH family protein [Limnothrix sp. FACHB-406]